MDDWIALRAVLSTLYPIQQDARRVVTDAGLNLAYFQFSDKAVDNWHNILTEAKNHNGINAILDIALSEYGANPELISAVQAYRATNHQQLASVENLSSAIDNVSPGGNTYISIDVNEQPLEWAPLWPSPRAEEPALIAEWIRIAQLKFNPFGPEQAEWDPELLEHHIDLPVFGECLRNIRSSIVFGTPGSGKTACKLLLTSICRMRASQLREENIFPVQCSIDSKSDVLATEQAAQNFVIEQLTRALIPFFALNPFTFLDLEHDAKLATATCLRHTFSAMENVKTQLRLNGLLNHRLGEQMLLDLDKLAPHLQNLPVAQRDWVGIISKARPKNFSRTFFICDLVNVNLTTVSTQAVYLQPLIDYIVSPATRSIYLKAFFPDVLQSHLTIPSHVAQCTVTWTVELLEQILKQRVRDEDGYRIHFEQLFDRAARSTNPARRLAEAAHGSPQQLIRLGNRLLEAHVRNRPGEIEISKRELNMILRQQKRING